MRSFMFFSSFLGWVASAEKKANIICGVVYRHHNSPEHFQEYFDETIKKLNTSGKKIIFMGDTNLNLLRFHSVNMLKTFFSPCKALT